MDISCLCFQILNLKSNFIPFDLNWESSKNSEAVIPMDVYHSILCHLCDSNVRASLCFEGEREWGGGGGLSF